MDAGSARAAPPPLFGRRGLLEEVRAVLVAAHAAGGCPLFLVGSAGVGKTAVLQRVRGLGEELGFRVLMGRSLPTDIPQPFSLMQDLLRRPGSTETFVPDSAALESAFLPVFLAPFGGEDPLLSTPSRAPTALDGAPAPPVDWLVNHLGDHAQASEESRATLFAELLEVFEELARASPVLLLVDDLPYADGSSIELLRQLFLRASSARVTLVATLPGGPLGPEVERLVALPSARRLEVPALSESEVAEYAHWMLGGQAVRPETLTRWYTQTEGNPLFVEQLIRASTGLASAGASPVGGSLAAILRDRVRSLSEDERRTLVYAAVLGREFDFATLAATLRRSEESITEDLDRLVRAGILREKGNEVYEFVSEVTRGTLYSELTETRRRILHRAAARALEARGRSTLFELARQYYLAREDEKAVEYNRRAADAALQAFAVETAVLHLERALECERRRAGHSPAVELRLEIELGQLFDELGSFQKAEELLGEAVAKCRAAPELGLELALALLGLARTRLDRSEFASARTLAAEAAGRLGDAGPTRARLAAERIWGQACWRLGEIDEALRHHLRAVAIAEAGNAPIDRGHTLVDLANTMLQRPGQDSKAALGYYEEAAKLFLQAEDYSARARVLMNRSLFFHSEGRAADALRDITRALEAAERSRSPIWIGYCLVNRAQYAAEAGDPEEAHRAIERAAGLLEPLGDRLALQQIQMVRGMVEEERGDFASARALYHRSIDIARELGLKPEEAEVLFRLAHLAQREGDLPVARDYLRSAKAEGVLSLRADLVRPVEALEAAIGPLA